MIVHGAGGARGARFDDGEEGDARRITQAALDEIARSSDPRKTYADALRTIAAARAMATSTGGAKQTLDAFEAQGRKAVAARLDAITPRGALPADAKEAFVRMLREHDLGPRSGAAQVTSVKGDASKGFEFEWKIGSKSGKAAAVKVDGEWFLSPAKLDKRTLDRATAEFRRYFDEEWAPELKDMGATRAEIAAARVKLTPVRALFPGESDPHGLTEHYPIVLQFRNETGSDHGCYAGVNPSTGEVEVYTFN